MKKLIFLCVIACFALANVPSVLSCTQPPPQPPKVWIDIRPNGVICIVVHDYTTFPSSPGFCACTLKNLNSLASCDSLVEALTGLFGFAVNAGVSASGGGLLGAPSTGFLAPVPQIPSPSVPVELRFYCTLGAGKTPKDVCSDLAAAGNSIVTGDADAGGNYIGPPHQAIRDLVCATVIPTLSEWGLIVIIAMVLALGIRVLARRRREGDLGAAA